MACPPVCRVPRTWMHAPLRRTAHRMSARPQLQVLPGLADAEPDVAFCGHCAPPPEPGGTTRPPRLHELQPRADRQRAGDAAPSPKEPFLLVDGALADLRGLAPRREAARRRARPRRQPPRHRAAGPGRRRGAPAPRALRRPSCTPRAATASVTRTSSCARRGSSASAGSRASARAAHAALIVLAPDG